MKQVQIPEELFVALVKYHVMNLRGMEKDIENGLLKKMDAVVQRDLYTKYKTAPTEQEKQKARKEYLDKRAIPDSFRW